MRLLIESLCLIIIIIEVFIMCAARTSSASRRAPRRVEPTIDEQATNPSVVAAVLAALAKQGVALVQPIVVPQGPVSVVPRETIEPDPKPVDDAVDPALLASLSQETGAHDAGLASMTRVGDVPDPQPKPEGEQVKLDAKDQTSAVIVPNVKVIQDTGDDKARYKLLYDRIQLSAEDKKIAKGTGVTFIDQEFGKGGRSELAAALEKQKLTMSQTAYMFALRAARNSYVPRLLPLHAGESVQDTERVAKDEHGEDIYDLGIDFLCWYDKLVAYAEDLCRKDYRKSAAAKDAASVDLQPAKVVFGEHWMQLKSLIRRSVKTGYDPENFENAGSYIAASKTARKKSGAAGATVAASASGARIVATDPSQPAKLDDYVAAMHPALGAPLAQLIEAVKAVAEIDAAAAGQILHNAVMAIKGLAIKTGDTANPLPVAA